MIDQFCLKNFLNEWWTFMLLHLFTINSIWNVKTHFEYCRNKFEKSIKEEFCHSLAKRKIKRSKITVEKKNKLFHIQRISKVISRFAIIFSLWKRIRDNSKLTDLKLAQLVKVIVNRANFDPNGSNTRS